MTAKNLHILLADDETEISALVASVLQRAGHTVDIANGGETAIALLKENPGRHQLVITDSNMPVVSGLDVIRHLRETHFAGKIMLLSGYVTEDLQDVYSSLNIDMIVEKPFSFARLNAAVKELVAALESKPAA